MKKIIASVFICVLVFCEVFGNNVVELSAATVKNAEICYCV